MKCIIVLCLFGLASVAYSKPGGKYTSKYDNIDLNPILQNRRLLIAYIKCVLDQGRCTAEGHELKSHIQEALQQNCGKCTDAQRAGTRRVMGHLINNEPDYWNQLKAKYDKEGKYSAKYEQDLRTLKA